MSGGRGVRKADIYLAYAKAYKENYAAKTREEGG
jgi:hypothetical protein